MKIRIAPTQPGDTMATVASIVVLPEKDLIIILIDWGQAACQDPQEGLAMWNRLYRQLDTLDPGARKPVRHLSLAV